MSKLRTVFDEISEKLDDLGDSNSIPKVKLEPLQLDFGNIIYKSRQEHTLVVSNIGKVRINPLIPARINYNAEYRHLVPFDLYPSLLERAAILHGSR